jgi:hypothetical protein
MNVHKSALLTPRGGERIIREIASGQTPEAVAEAQASVRGPFASGLRDTPVSTAICLPAPIAALYPQSEPLPGRWTNPNRSGCRPEH